MSIDPLAIAQVTPYAWESGHEVNRHIDALSHELATRGHRISVIAPSSSAALVRAGRKAIRAARDDAASILPAPGSEPLVLAVGEVLSLPTGRGSRARSVPLDVSRAVEEAMVHGPWDVVHVHEPFAPSAASVALRNSRALNIGSFHAPTERLVSTQLARRLVELVFGRLDARTAATQATADLMARFFPATYRVISPGAPVFIDRAALTEPPHIVFIAEEERPALRLFIRALRRLPLDVPWRATVYAPHGSAQLTSLRRELRERVSAAETDRIEDSALLASADIVVAASGGAQPVPGLLLRAIGAGAVPVAARLGVYEETLDEGELGLLFEPGDVETLAAQLTRLVCEPARITALQVAGAARQETLGVEHVADAFETVYAEAVGRRHDPTGNPAVRKRLAKRKLIDVDLHMHTDHSHDCATPVEVLLATAREQGLGAIAVTDHNEVSGALEARAKAADYGVKVIVAEEVKTASQGEVIGLFIEEKIPRGLTLEETIAEIKRQGGLVYVPHPFDRLHSVPDYEHLLAVLDDVDAIEVFNPRVAISSFNDEAARFAAKYRLVAGAGSDSHVAQGLGSVRIRMRDFDGPEEFLESLRDADIARKPTSLVYVQALKFLETKATPPPMRKAVRERRVRKATRNS